ncbi:hypothetical protein [Methyloceanibacter caenitepidi]|uniref:Uncharacterized protein n=1 Tax=Methyloceanibacter caenitepidi TaxID=1384459 RepID=A0A0A8K567_9HYPH|nr:hypothetical protein [Methyloceanibacter caenitepidi]BAQ17687.1 hypothetical protein GL4_2245 [Methyloceanibacter caenitepidi]
MKLNAKAGATIAATAAALLVSGTLVTAAVAGEQGKCFGVNACKGKSACKTAANACKGHNACKGQGFLVMSEKKCARKGGSFQG